MASNWKTYTNDDWTAGWIEVRHAPGCYVVYCDGHLKYVGQSTDVAARIYFHRMEYHGRGFIRTPWGKYRHVTIKVRYAKKFGDWAMVELRLIRRLQPPENCRGSRKKQRPRKLLAAIA